MIAEIVATLTAGLFTGAAAYINFVEQPARLSCGPQLALAEWRPSYRRGTVMQAPLALVGSVSAFLAGWLDGEAGWVIGGILFFLVIPFTLVIILPTNKRLENAGLDPSSQEAMRLLRRWGRLHAVRSILSAAAFVVFVFMLIIRR